MRFGFRMGIVSILITIADSAVTFAQPQPDMDGSGCVDLIDVALFQIQFGTSDIPGLAPCDFHVDGHCDLDDHAAQASMLGGPACVCGNDADCYDDYSCTEDLCAGVACLHLVTCPNQDDSDADCIHEYCTVAGCVVADEPYFSLCEDGLPCSILDYCDSGNCFAGVFDDPECPEDGDEDCVRRNGFFEPDGSPCDDGITCTTHDACRNGQCEVGVLNDALCGGPPDDDADCRRQMCLSGGCVLGYEPDGSPCDDGVTCTTRDACRNGRCEVGILDDNLCGPPDDDADCVRHVCFPFGCVTRPELDGSPCDDGHLCSSVDSCQKGICVYGGIGDSLCGNADDTDADCVHGYCTPNGCVIGDEPDGSPCGDDGLACTDQSCLSGQCVFVPNDSRCDNNDADADCIRADCDPDAGCILAIEPDGSACEDGIACTGSDYCLTGQCNAGIYYDFLCPNQDYCDDDCVQFYCEPGQGCVQGVEFESAPCWDFFCAIREQFSACSAAGVCECRLQPPPNFGCP